MEALGVRGPRLLSRAERGDGGANSGDGGDEGHRRGPRGAEGEHQDDARDQQADQFADADLGVLEARGRAAAVADGEAVHRR